MTMNRAVEEKINYKFCWIFDDFALFPLAFRPPPAPPSLYILCYQVQYTLPAERLSRAQNARNAFPAIPRRQRQRPWVRVGYGKLAEKLCGE